MNNETRYVVNVLLGVLLLTTLIACIQVHRLYVNVLKPTIAYVTSCFKKNYLLVERLIIKDISSSNVLYGKYKKVTAFFTLFRHTKK